MGSVAHLQLVLDEVAAGRHAALVTVVRTDRSTPRRHGATMVVFADGRCHGTVGGGEMEARAREAASSALLDGQPRLITYRLVDPSIGDPGVCGGEMDVYVEPYMTEPTLVVLGAGHVGRAVTDLASWLGWTVIVWDDRPDQLEGITNATSVSSGPVDQALTAAGIDSRTALVVVTRNVALDREIIPALLSTKAGYIGLMGSGRRWTTTRAMLLEDGISEDQLSRIQTPIGLEIGAETPEEIAISIMAEVVRARSER